MALSKYNFPYLINKNIKITIYRHIQEDLQHHSDSMVQNRNISDMSEDEKNFFYFKLHDSDNNDVLDGLELLRAATHHSVHIEHDEAHDHRNDGEKSEDEANDIEHIIGRYSMIILKDVDGEPVNILIIISMVLTCFLLIFQK